MIMSLQSIVRRILRGSEVAGYLKISALRASYASAFFDEAKKPELLPLNAADCAWGV